MKTPAAAPIQAPPSRRASIGRLPLRPACRRRRRRSASSTSARRPAERPCSPASRLMTTPNTIPPNASSAKPSRSASPRRAIAPRRTSGSPSSIAPPAGSPTARPSSGWRARPTASFVLDKSEAGHPVWGPVYQDAARPDRAGAPRPADGGAPMTPREHARLQRGRCASTGKTPTPPASSSTPTT